VPPIDQVAKAAKQAERAAKRMAEGPKPPGHDRSLIDLKKQLPPPDEWNATIEAIKNDSPRSAALLAVAHLDCLLEEQIRFRFRGGTDEVQKLLLGPGAALSSTEAKANLLFCLGVFGEVTLADIKTICGIRNVFAHSPQIVTFEHMSIRNKCAELKTPKAYLMSYKPSCWPLVPMADVGSPRYIFINTAIGLGMRIWCQWALGEQGFKLDLRVPDLP
jgi:hypothetical protein